MSPVVPPAAAIAVDPPLLADASEPVMQSAGALRAALPAVTAAWAAAGRTLAPHHTGAVLAACQAQAAATLGECAQSLEAYATALLRAASVYRAAESTAVPPTIPVPPAIPAPRVPR